MINLRDCCSNHLGKCELYFLEEGRDSFDEVHSLTIPINRFGEFDDYNFKCLVFQQYMDLGIFRSYYSKFLSEYLPQTGVLQQLGYA